MNFGKPELRTAAMHVAVRPSVKAAAQEMAAADRRSGSRGS